MPRGLVRLTFNLTTLEERKFQKEVALYSFKVRKFQDGFFAGNFA